MTDNDSNFIFVLFLVMVIMILTFLLTGCQEQEPSMNDTLRVLDKFLEQDIRIKPAPSR